VIRTPIGGSYFTVSRTWKAGDVVRVAVPFRLRVEKAVDDPTLQTLFHGPVNLVARNSATSYCRSGCTPTRLCPAISCRRCAR